MHFVGNTVYPMIYVAANTQLGVFIMVDLRVLLTIDKIIYDINYYKKCKLL